MKNAILNKLNAILWAFMVRFGLVSCVTNDIDSIYDQLSLENADQPIRRRTMNPAGRLVTSKRAMLVGNPKSVAQFDINVSITHITLAAAPTEILDLPVLLFGQADFEGNYKKGLGLLPVPAGVSFLGSLIYPNLPAGFPVASVPGASIGDLVFYYQKGTSVYAVIVNCPQVAFGTLLAATNSDNFTTNLIRYSLPSPTVLGQYNQAVTIFKQSLFGKTENDSFNPLSYKNPNQQQTNIIDIPVGITINKRTEVGVYMTTEAVVSPLGTNILKFSWSIFVESDRKI